MHLGNLGNRYADLGDARKSIEYYEQTLVIFREVGEKQNEGGILSNLGLAYANLGDILKAIEFFQQALVIARETGNRRIEEIVLGNLGSGYSELGDPHKAIGFYEQAIIIDREIGARNDEATDLGSIGSAFLNIEKYQKSQESYQQAIQIADEISFPLIQNGARCGLAETNLFQNDLVNACATIEAALQYDVPENNHNASALHGIIALRQGVRSRHGEPLSARSGRRMRSCPRRRSIIPCWMRRGWPWLV